MKKVALFAIALASMTAAVASAEEKKVDWTPCNGDIAKFTCSGSEEEIYNCLLKHDSELSEACDTVHAAYEEATGKKKG